MIMFHDRRYREERDLREEKQRIEAEAREAHRQKEFLFLLLAVMGNRSFTKNIFDNA